MLDIIGAFWGKSTFGWRWGTWFTKVELFDKTNWLSERGGILSICDTFSVQNYTFLSEICGTFWDQNIIDQINRKKMHKFVAIPLKKSRKYMKNTFCDGISLIFLYFFIKGILHYNRAILLWIIKNIKKIHEKYVLLWKIHVFWYFHKIYFTI